MTTQPTTAPDCLTIQEAASLVGVSVATLYRYRRLGMFPEPNRIGPRLTRWPRTAISAGSLARPLATALAISLSADNLQAHFNEERLCKL